MHQNERGSPLKPLFSIRNCNRRHHPIDLRLCRARSTCTCKRLFYSSMVHAFPSSAGPEPADRTGRSPFRKLRNYYTAHSSLDLRTGNVEIMLSWILYTIPQRMTSTLSTPIPSHVRWGWILNNGEPLLVNIYLRVNIEQWGTTLVNIYLHFPKCITEIVTNCLNTLAQLACLYENVLHMLANRPKIFQHVLVRLYAPINVLP